MRGGISSLHAALFASAGAYHAETEHASGDLRTEAGTGRRHSGKISSSFTRYSMTPCILRGRLFSIGGRSGGKPTFASGCVIKKGIRSSFRAGLLAGSVILAGSAFAQLPAPPKQMSVDANGVDARTGNETWSIPELDIGPAGEQGLHLARHHAEGVDRNSFASTYYMTNLGDGFHSVAASFGMIGDTFASNFSPKGSFIDEGSYKYQSRDGTIVTFNTAIWDHFGTYGDNSEDVYRLADTATFPSGVKLTIHYRIEQISGVPIFRIQSVTSNTGYQIKFRYSSNVATGGNAFTQPSQAVGINMGVEYCDPDADDCALAQAWPTTLYSPVGATKSVTDPNGGVTTYSTTNGSSSSLSITTPGNSTPSVTYNYTSIISPCDFVTNHTFCSMGYFLRVSSVLTPDKTTSYVYTGGSEPSYFTTITSTDPGGISNVYQSHGYNVLGVWQTTDPLNHVSKFEFDSSGLMTKATWPEGNFTEFQLDANGNVLQEIAHGKGNSATLTHSRTFGPCAMNIATCTSPLTVTDARNNTTTYQYNAHGQKISEVGPPDQNGVRPVHRWFYADRYAYVKNTSGQLVAAPSPVSVPTSEKVCRTSFNGSLTSPACGSTADEVVTTYEYASGPVENALLPRGTVVTADGVSRRTCFGYDRFGNKIWQKSPRAGATACS